jgi:hypothetical protein
MKETININPIYDSTNILFSIPVHENQEIINNHIENIFNFNPNCKIILHINKSFTNFNKNITSYRNLYINSRQHQYIYGKGLLWIHISNFLECIRLGIDFKYFSISSSNEMFIRHGLNNYMETYKNGAQIVEFDINNPWHIFHRGLENDEEIKQLLSYLNLSKFYGGQTEGQFYEKHVFQKICDIYLQIFGTREISQFETEELLPQTIFKSMGLEYGLPYTLQNYSNKIEITEKFITNLVNNPRTSVIPNNLVKGNLKAAHANMDGLSIFSIKRVDRNFNNIRNFLTRKGFILNSSLEVYQKNTCYYSHGSILEVFNENHISFRKNINNIKSPKKFQWFGYETCGEKEGYFNVTFEIKTKYEIINSEQCGLKINETLHSEFLNELKINTWKYIRIPIYIEKEEEKEEEREKKEQKEKNKQNIIFIFDGYNDILNIEIKNFCLEPYIKEKNEKEDIIISLFSNNSGSDYSINSNNILKNIIIPFYELYNVYILIFLFGEFTETSNLQKLYNPHKIKHIRKTNYYIEQMKEILNFKSDFELNLKFMIYVNLDSIFEKNISNLPFYINKFNFLYYTATPRRAFHYEKLPDLPKVVEVTKEHMISPPLNNDLCEICNSINLFSIPTKYIDIFYNILITYRNNDVQNLYMILYSEIAKRIDKSNIQILIDDIFIDGIDNLYVKNLKNVGLLNNNQGFLFNHNYINEVCYTNKYCKFIKSINDGVSYYFKKKYTEYQTSWCWCGLYINDYDENGKEVYATVSFDIKLLKNIRKSKESNKDWGLKTHYPMTYYNSWVEQCILNEFVSVRFQIKINRNSQYVIYNFDNYNDEVEFIIKNFKLKLE